MTRPVPLRPEPSVMDGAVSAVFGRRQSILEMSSRNAFPVIQQNDFNVGLFGESGTMKALCWQCD